MFPVLSFQIHNYYEELLGLSILENRPSFTELVTQLSDLLSGMAGYLDLEAVDTKL